jgi:hypothetical protein
MNFYSGLVVINTIPGFTHGDLHVTTMFAPIVATQRMQTVPDSEQCKIVSVEHWADPDITVAVLKSHLAEARHRYFSDAGFKYGHEYIPHITLCKGNHVSKYQGLISYPVVLGHEYIRFKK